MKRLLRTLRAHPWQWGLGVGLLVAVGATALVRLYAVRAVDSTAEARQQRVVDATLGTAVEQFEQIRGRLHGQAQTLARDSVVRAGVAAAGDSGARPARLSRYMAARPSGALTTVEVYSANARVLAWSGQRLPVHRARLTERIPSIPRTTIVRNVQGRWVLAAWVPVARAGEIKGAVRVAQVVRYRPPVQNRYVQAVSLEDRWSRRTGEVVRVRWNASPPAAPHRPLRAVDGTVLGHVSVVPPSPTRLVERTAAFYTDLLVGGAVGLLGWGLWMGGHWYLRLVRRPGLRRHGGARRAAAARFVTVLGGAVGVRYALLGLDVPGRWVASGTGLAPLFDPTYFASPLGGGLLRSIGDVLLTGAWAGGLSVGLLLLAQQYRPRADSLSNLPATLRAWAPRVPHTGRFVGTLVGLAGMSLGGVVVLALVVRRAVLDSTLDFFSRTGLLPEPLVLGVLCGLFLLVAAAGLSGIAGVWIAVHRLLRYRPRTWPRGIALVLGTGLLGMGVAGLYLGTEMQTLVPPAYMGAALVALAAGAAYGLVGTPPPGEVLTLRGLLGGVFAMTLLLYPLLYAGMDAKRQEHMVEAARSFEQGQDPRVLYAVRQGLRTAAVALPADLRPPAQVDSVAARLLRRSLLSSLAAYEVRLSLLARDGTVWRQYAPGGRLPTAAGARSARRAFEALRPDDARAPGGIIEQLPRDGPAAPALREPLQYAGLIGLPPEADSAAAWVLLQATSHSLLPASGYGMARALLPDGSYADLYADLSLAKFRDGTLVRSVGRDFGRTRLRPAERRALAAEARLWRQEEVRGRQYLTHYRRLGSAPEADVAAVRIPAIRAFDHLYYLLRLTVAGLCVGLLVYLLGLVVRARRGGLPASRVRFRNKVLDAFLVVGIVSMVAVGVVGVRVVTGQNDRAMERRMHEHLARVEEALALEARADETLWQAAERMDVDTLAARVGLDLHLYRDAQLVRTSQPRLLRIGLLHERLPGAVYQELYHEAYRFVTADAAIGQFQYRVGYQALVDATGRPRLVVGVPTLAQQEQLQEEKSRTLAYLFGALLLLVVVVMLTGVVLANALAQPVAQLRKGLEAVGKGRFTRSLSVDTRDEIGDLVQTFNEMRDQLAESRRKLARQERELAWREMARQVAHEIKNPLTPMKLSIQHLRRAFKQARQRSGAAAASDFAEVFDRITSTLIEQVEALVRIADEFSTFARLPTRVPEPVDLTAVIEEAAALMEEEAANHDALELELPDAPLVVEADREELRRLYINLLKNALQAIPDAREGHVRVTARLVPEHAREGPSVYSEVMDNGTGIPEEVRDKVFEPNFSTKTSGTGLGLAIAQKSIDELGGEIGYETTEGEGTTFWLRLPLAAEEEREA
jgi:signal transduction histidine kinase